MSKDLKSIHTHALDFWFARSSVIVIIVLQLLIVNKLTLGPRWLAPTLEVALLAPLSFATAWTQGMAREASNHAGSSGQSLLLDAINIWATNVIAFALWYWSIDRGGAASKGLMDVDEDDFLFPQMTIAAYEHWSPGFTDYLYLSFTNATAFSPTDTMPLSERAKLLMMAKSGISLLTLALVAARAVNILN